MGAQAVYPHIPDEALQRLLADLEDVPESQDSWRSRLLCASIVPVFQGMYRPRKLIWFRVFGFGLHVSSVKRHTCPYSTARKLHVGPVRVGVLLPDLRELRPDRGWWR